MSIPQALSLVGLVALYLVGFVCVLVLLQIARDKIHWVLRHHRQHTLCHCSRKTWFQ